MMLNYENSKEILVYFHSQNIETSQLVCVKVVFFKKSFCQDIFDRPVPQFLSPGAPLAFTVTSLTHTRALTDSTLHMAGVLIHLQILPEQPGKLLPVLLLSVRPAPF